MRKMGIPAADVESCPPEARLYHQAYLEHMRDGAPYSYMVNAMDGLRPDPYHSFSLGQLIIALFDGHSLTDEVVQSWITRSGEELEGAFTQEEQAAFFTLLEQMLAPSNENRILLQEVRIKIWQLLAPRLTVEDSRQGDIKLRARKLLRTLTFDSKDEIACDVHKGLASFWR
jgi:hypothetical protein